MTEADPAASPSQPSSPLRTVLSEESGLSILLFVLIAYSLVAALFSGLFRGPLALAGFTALFAVVSVFAVAKRPILIVCVRVVGLAVVLSACYEIYRPGWAIFFVTCTLSAIMVGLVLVAVALQVFQDGPVTAHRVRGAVVIYLLIGSLFGLLYLLVFMAQPEAFRSMIDLANSDPQTVRDELAYFSLVTLSTLGYGDVTPVSRLARSLATFEAISGQLYLAITIARLVSSLSAGRNGSSDGRT